MLAISKSIFNYIEMWQSIAILAGGIPIGILFVGIFYQQWKRKQRSERSPLSEKLARPPGYGLQRELEDLNDSFDTYFSCAFLFSILAIGGIPFYPSSVASRVVFLTVFDLFSAASTVLALQKINEIRNHRRGLLGEQAVAEQLQPLLANGYRIFHDIPCSNNNCKWNIDHVAVGPGGVFAIETKYRTKKPGKEGGPDHKAAFDGNRIEFASGDYDAKAVGQARNNARWLEVEMSKAIGERVTAQPIVALPGWWVDRMAKSDVRVLSGKEVTSYISKEPAHLSSETIQRISYQLDRLCRDVEF